MNLTIERHVDVRAPVGDTYAAWWRSFEEVDPGGDAERETSEPQRYRWRASVAGVGEEWVAKLTECIPGRRLAWSSVDGAHRGCVSFYRLGTEHTRVLVELRVEPEGWLESLGAWLGVLESRVDAALEEFKNRLEADWAWVPQRRSA